MKAFLDEYFRIIMYTIFGLLLVVSSYSIILNIRHYKSLNQKAIVSEIDLDYKKYKENVVKIENNLNKNVSDTSELSLILNQSLKVLKDDGVFRLLPNERLSFYDLYKLNEYLMEQMVNDFWIYELREVINTDIYDEKMDVIVSNSKYIRHNLVNNGLILSDNNIKDSVTENYTLILKNYRFFSDIILKVSDSVGGNDEIND